MPDKTLNTSPGRLIGRVQVPGDKSISHRAIMFGSIAQGETVIENILQAEDVQTTQSVYQQLGVKIEATDEHLKIQGRGFSGLQEPVCALDFGNSGTTLRLSLGILAARPFAMHLIGDASLSQRPMARVLEPLGQMGLHIPTDAKTLPLDLEPNAQLNGLDYVLPVASAQVKSALIFAGLQAQSATNIVEPIATRDHTERMLTAFGGTSLRHENTLTIQPEQTLHGTTLQVPGDFSSAAFWLVAGLLVPDSHIILPKVGLNPTRTGLMQLLEKMGAHFELTDVSRDSEPMGTISVTTQTLQAIQVTEVDIPAVIDEIPLLVLAATQAQGVSEIRGAEELRVKETDRIQAVTQELRKLGADITEHPDGFTICGPTPLHVVNKTQVNSHGDHRIGMMLAIAALMTEGEVKLSGSQAINISYPRFFEDLATLWNE
ncbi:3-phosphoshikimate 1-carboxyvinyltransferase [Weissella minor]|uniref:3-phosphoshikimate 1-carboxyvinyltransferase n=1 Tax=Weissella minor TaxID=1620 RepID=UPI001BAF8936|nr:3-phosphoshikimate 1-carboxyvinyltransferase [Weissella minor]MBS0949823.1 3-phosphoshikimate 1-carboxyvinyltransferase [Weissella minor]